jgi:hypothetical protein
LIPDGLKFRGQRTLFKSWEKSLDSLVRMLSVRMVIRGTIVVIVPLFTSHLFKAVMLLMSVFNPVACIFAADNVAQVSVIPSLPSATFLWWSKTASQVPARTLPVVKLVTLCFIITVECQVNHGRCIQHHLEAIHMCINLFVVLWQVGSELIDKHP